MRSCPNPGCPFRVRHGFAAEFEDSVERCRSCTGPLRIVEADTSSPNPALARAAWIRAGVSALLAVGLVGYARAPVPGEPALMLGTWSLWPALVTAIPAALLVSRKRVQSSPGRTAARLAAAGVCTALIGGGIVGFGAALGALASAQLLMALLAGLIVVTGVIVANDRWGLGQGSCLAVAAVLLHGLILDVEHAPGPGEAALVRLALVAGTMVWLGQPTRAVASSRRAPDSKAELGLGLTVPNSSLLPLLLVVLARSLAALPGMPELRELAFPAWLGALALPTVPELSVCLTLTIALAWLFGRPGLLLASWRRAFPKADPAALDAEAHALFRRSTLRSVLLVGALEQLAQLPLPVLSTAILAAVLLDQLAELRLRSEVPDLIVVAAPEQVHEANALAQALELERRPALVVGRQHRALYAALAGWIPARLLVRAQDQARVEELR